MTAKAVIQNEMAASFLILLLLVCMYQFPSVESVNLLPPKTPNQSVLCYKKLGNGVLKGSKCNETLTTDEPITRNTPLNESRTQLNETRPGKRYGNETNESPNNMKTVIVIVSISACVLLLIIVGCILMIRKCKTSNESNTDSHGSSREKGIDEEMQSLSKDGDSPG